MQSHAVCMSLERSFAPAELSALRLDGDAFSLYRSTLLCDEPDVVSTRVALARGDASARLVIDRLSAAWVWHALAAPPTPPMLCSDIRARTTKQIGEAVLRTYRFTDDDIIQTSAGPVLSRWRTLLHVLRFDASSHPEAISTLAASLGVGVRNLEQLITERVHPAAQRRYLEPLARVVAQESVTRYTS